MKVVIEESKPAVTETDLSRLEAATGSRLPEEYRLFLLTHNGGRPTPNVFAVPAAHIGEADVDWFLAVWDGEYANWLSSFQNYRHRIPAGLVPIAHDSGGNLICIGVEGDLRDKIFYWDHENESSEDNANYWGNIYLIANSFNLFLANLYSLGSAL